MSHHDDLPAHYCQGCAEPESMCKCPPRQPTARELEAMVEQLREWAVQQATEEAAATLGYSEAASAYWHMVRELDRRFPQAKE